MGTTTAVTDTAIILANAGELLGIDSPYDKGRRALQREVQPILKAAKKVVKVETAEDAKKATEFGRLLHVAAGERTAYFKQVKLQIDAIKDPILQAEKEDVNPLNDEKRRIGALLTAWQQKQDEEQRERDRIAREAAEKAAREDILSRAVEAEEGGDLFQAEAILEEPLQHNMVITQAQAPAKIQGKVGRITYGARVIGWEPKMETKPDNHPGWKNFLTLVKAVACGDSSIRSLLPNESFINGEGNRYKEGFSMPGCEGTKKASTNFRG